MSHGVEAIVLVKDDGTDTTDHEVFVGCVSQRVPIVATITGDALMKLGVRLAIH